MDPVNAGCLVSIGTTHPWNIAGVGLDARVAAEYGLEHAAAIAAVSAQDAAGVHALHIIPCEVIEAQLRALPQPIAAVRIGALGASQSVRCVADFLKERAGEVPIVVDPVVRATLGGALQNDADVLGSLAERIVPLSAVLTPNLNEAELLARMRVQNENDMTAAGRRLLEMGARAALITGGHLPGDPVDVLVTRETVIRFSGPRLPGSMRGSGCTLAASLACELALGAQIADAAARAHAYVREKIAASTVRGGLQVAF